MGWFSRIFGWNACADLPDPAQQPPLRLEPLEPRTVPALGLAYSAGQLRILGGPGDDNIIVVHSGADVLEILDHGVPAARVPSAAVTSISVTTGVGNDRVMVAPDVLQPVAIDGGAGDDLLVAGGGDAILIGGSGNDLLIGGTGHNLFNGGAGSDQLFRINPGDSVAVGPGDVVHGSPLPTPPLDPPAPTVLSAAEVDVLLKRASAATRTSDAIIAVVDRNGRILGVWVEGGVSPLITGNDERLTFAVDGAVAKARTGAFFANNQAPLTSRTVQFISQSTITQREVESDPNITDPNSPLRGPGFVAPVGLGAHFPPNIAQTPPVDLFAIEHTNRDSIVNPGPDRIKGTADDVLLPDRFNINPAFVPPGQTLFAPESYGFVSGIDPGAQSRGIATLPGGIPLYKNGTLVGGIGVFFPGTTGFATEENSALSATFNPTKPDRSFEAEFIAFAAAGGTPSVGFGFGALGGVPALPGFALPFGRIDLVGITLDIFGPGGAEGVNRLVGLGQAIGTGAPVGGEIAVDPGPNGLPHTPDDVFLKDGLPVPEGWLVVPHSGVGITATQALQAIVRGVTQATRTRAAIRLPLSSSARMVVAVTDLVGNVVGLFRMPDATVFSIDVAVAKARNVAYYANPLLLQPVDRLPGIPRGVASTSRTFRFLSGPRYPDAIDFTPPGPFSTLNDGGVNPRTGLRVGPPLPASAFRSVLGFDAFNPGTNFRDPLNILNQNGIVFFPGSAPLYRSRLIGGLGVSGDGVDQDDVVTFAATALNRVPAGVLRADFLFFRGVRLPYQKFNRNPEGI
jgi:uncharacterized protein GlcG (DUF336 family)